MEQEREVLTVEVSPMEELLCTIQDQLGLEETGELDSRTKHAIRGMLRARIRSFGYGVARLRTMIRSEAVGRWKEEDIENLEWTLTFIYETLQLESVEDLKELVS